jgi:hypothetical protein
MAELRASHQASPQCPQESSPMNGSNKQTENINGICEGVSCNAKATSKVPVKVGAKERIVLLLCEKCKQRFSYSKSQSAQINGVRRL